MAELTRQTSDKSKHLITFIEKVKEGEYVKSDTSRSVPLRSTVYRDDTDLENQYYYTTK